MSEKSVVCILGKLPPPYMGPAVATEILLNSGLKNNFTLIHIDTKINADLRDMGSWSFKKLLKNLNIYFTLIKKEIRSKPDLVLIPISQSTVGFLKDSIYIILSRILGRKVLLHLRGSEFQIWMNRSGNVMKAYVRWVLSITSGVIVLGENLRYLFEGFYPANKIFVSPNGGDYIIPARKRKEEEKVRILYLGNLQPSKGIEDLIEAIALLNTEDLQKIEVEVIGGWRKESTRLKCLKLIQDFSLPVSFYSPEVSLQKFEFLSNADIFVFPPREPEGHPWVIVEAMAAGLPIISTDRGAIIESVKDGDNGFIVPLADPRAIAEALKTLLADPEKRKRMGLNSRKKYESGFTEARMVENLTKIFHKVIEV